MSGQRYNFISAYKGNIVRNDFAEIRKREMDRINIVGLLPMPVCISFCTVCVCVYDDMFWHKGNSGDNFRTDVNDISVFGIDVGISAGRFVYDVCVGTDSTEKAYLSVITADSVFSSARFIRNRHIGWNHTDTVLETSS